MKSGKKSESCLQSIETIKTEYSDPVRPLCGPLASYFIPVSLDAVVGRFVGISRLRI